MVGQRLFASWWGLMLRGLLAVAFGLAIIAMPAISLAALVVLFGLYALIEGVVAIASAFRAHATHPRWWVLLIEGLVSVAAGLLTFAWPGISALALVFVIAFYTIVRGAIEIAAAVALHKQIHGEWLLGIGGLLSIAIGVYMLARPGVGALALVVWIGLYAIVYGAVLIIHGGRLLAVTRPGGRLEKPAAAR
jgi:uncharacterized membrane protein HdeD (DUF308 family)